MNCSCCQSGPEENKIILSGQQNGDRNIYSCSNCKHIFRDYSYIDLDRYYNEQYRRTLKGTELADREILLERDGRLINLIKSYIKKEDKILELGSGDGNFASLLKENINSIDITCCEKDKDLSKICFGASLGILWISFFTPSDFIIVVFYGFLAIVGLPVESIKICIFYS